jgi:hypothetical protein
VLSVQDQCETVVQGDALQTLHGSILLSAAVLAHLRLPPAIERAPPPGLQYRLAFVYVLSAFWDLNCEGETIACHMF